MIPLQLSNVKPDFDSILMQLQMYLQATGTWSDLQTSGTGQTILEMMAAIGTMNQFAVESAAREGSLTTAVRDSSIYAITRMLGVRIHRKSPATVSAQLSRKDSSVSEFINTYSQFDVGGKPFFNRHPLMFVQGSLFAAERLYYGSPVDVTDQFSFQLDLTLITSLKIKTGDTFKVMINSGADANQIRTFEYLGGNVGNNLFRMVTGELPFTSLSVNTRLSLLRDTIRLYEGEIIEEIFTSDGTAFQQLYLKNKWFSVSDVDVDVQVLDDVSETYIAWSKTEDGMWVSGPFDKVFFDSTSGAGEAIITFGDDTNGAMPKLGNTVKIRYAVTKGSKSNTGMTNLPVAISEINGVEGVTVSVISGGADEKPASYYRVMAPLIFKARNRGITVSDYKAVALDYPGIISVSVQTQRDIASDDLRWMNQIQMCLLPAADNVLTLTSAEWDDFFEYMERKKHAAVRLIKKDPTLQLCNIDLTLALKTSYVPTAVVPYVEDAVGALFNRQSDTLGRRITVSDVMRAAMSITGVDYCIVNKCVLSGMPDAITDLIPIDNTHFLDLGALTINTKYSEREVY